MAVYGHAARTFWRRRHPDRRRTELHMISRAPSPVQESHDHRLLVQDRDSPLLVRSLRTSQEAGVEPGVGAVTPALFSIAATAVDAGGVLRPVVPTGSGNTMMDALHGRRHPEGVGWYDRGADRPICLPIQPTERGQETCHLAPGDERLRRAFVPGHKSPQVFYSIPPPRRKRPCHTRAIATPCEC